MSNNSKPNNIKTTVFASSFGTLFEWYDFLIYGTAAALVFNVLFFPTVDPFVGMIVALLTYAVGFFARPFGGALFGHLGDKYGRKSVLTATMILMGFSTFAIGLLPTYEQVGILAPILLVLLRILQGIGFGGEWGGAALMILETCPKEKRGFYSSFIQVGFPLGLLLSSGIFSLVSMLPKEDLMSWGWRIPFLLSIILVAIGGYVRSKLSETPVFNELKSNNKVSRKPFFDVLFKYPKETLIAIGIKVTEVSWSYLVTVFLVAYATSKLGLEKSLLLESISLAALINLFAIPFFGWVSDKIGRKPLFYIGSIFTIVMAFPLFTIVSTGSSIAVMAVVIAGMVLGNAMMFSALAAYLAEIYEPQVRYTGLSFSNQVAAAIGGGLAPTIAGVMTAVFSGTTGVSIMMIMFATITLVCNYLAKPKY